MSNDLKKFKDRILFEKIHQSERYSRFTEASEDALNKLRWIKLAERQGFDAHSTSVYECYMCFIQIGLKINYAKNLIALCDDLERSGFNSWEFHESKAKYYQDYFRSEIIDARKIMQRLKPYVRMYLSDKNDEFKKREMERVPGKWFSSLLANKKA